MTLVTLTAVTSATMAGVHCRRWGGQGKGLAYPGTLKVFSAGVPRVVFDLSAVPKGAKVHRATLLAFTRSRGQPRDPIQIFQANKVGADGKASWSGKPLALLPPYWRSFDATAAVARWVKDPKTNLGLAAARFDGFDAGRTVLEILYEAPRAVGKAPAQVDALRAVHHGGQTFLIWKELPLFRPAADKIFWVSRYDGLESEKHPEPGEGFGGLKRVPAVTLKTLRDLQGLSVRGKKGPREMQPIRVLKKRPDIRYRVYRHKKKITAKTLPDAELLGEVAPTRAIIERMLSIMTQGEYYNPWENPDSVLLTWCYDANKPVMPGEALYVHTPQAGGSFYYAVTVMQDGRENVSDFSGSNTSGAVAETPATPAPVLQYVTRDRRNRKGLQYHHAYWMAPPVANLPGQDPKRVIVGRIPTDKAPFGLVVRPNASGMFFGGGVAPGAVHLTIEQDLGYGADLGYSQGRGTLRSFAESKVDYYSDRYIMANVTWAMKRYKIDPARIVCQANPHMALRHGEFFRVLFLGPFELDMNRRWNPGSGSLGGIFGPADSAMTVDGHKAWNIVDIRYQLSIDPGRDIPFMACYFTQPKDGNHGAEYGWQDDPQGLAALRDFRQPYVGQWGGASVAGEVRTGLGRLRWDKSVPAFSHCSLDNNPGNGDPDDGEPWGQINGYLFWDYASIVDAKDRWEMTVYLVPSSPEDTCTVDVTPRQCRAFKAKPGQTFSWTNTSVKDSEVLGRGDVQADKFGLVTLKQTAVTKGRNRISIVGK